MAQTKEMLSKQAVQTKEILSKQAVKIAKQAEEHERFINKVLIPYRQEIIYSKLAEIDKVVKYSFWKKIDYVQKILMLDLRG